MQALLFIVESRSRSSWAEAAHACTTLALEPGVLSLVIQEDVQIVLGDVQPASATTPKDAVAC